MRKSTALFLFCLSFFPFLALAQASQGQHQWFSLPDGLTDADYIEKRVVFRVKEAYRPFCSALRIDEPKFSRYLDAIKATGLKKTFPKAEPPQEKRDRLGRQLADLSLIYELDYSSNTDIVNAVNLLLETNVVEYAEPAYIYQPFFDPNDPDTAGQYYLALIHARQAWDISHGDSNIVIGIIDTGWSFLHPDCVSKTKWNYNDPIDGFDNDNNGYIDDFRGWDFGGFWHDGPDNDPTWVGVTGGSDHGVLTGGAAACATDNGVNVAATGFNCRILPVKVSIDNTPQIYYGFQGIVYAADMGCKIINLSWGGGGNSKMGEDAIRYAAINKDIMVVAAAGNTWSASNVINFFPASFPEVISVTGSQQLDAFWHSSGSFGTSMSYFADLSAPSRDILTTTTDAGTYAATGTSLGSPIVCGIGGLVKAEFPSLTMGQVGQMVRRGADENIYTLNSANYAERMGKGRADAFGALMYTGPSVRAVEVFYDAGADGLIQAGDTIDMRVRWANFLDPVSNLQIDMTTPSFGDLEIVEGSVYAGNIGTLDTASNWLCPFKVVIRSSALAGTLAYLRIGYVGTGYTDYEYYGIRVQPSYVNIDRNRLETSMDGRGRWGYTNFPTLSNGKGLVIDGDGSMINDAGFMVGKDASHVSNNFEKQGSGADQHFVNVTPIQRTLGGQLADVEAYTSYTDAAAGANALTVTVNQRTYQWSMEGDDNYIIQEYTIHNSGSSALNGIYAGMYMDYDGYWSSNNKVRYDDQSRCVYDSTEDYVTLWNAGISLLTNDSIRGYAADITGFSFSQSAKWNALTSLPQAANVTGVDAILFTGTGPFNIAVGDSHVVAFALIPADSVPHLRSSFQAAYTKYWCVVRDGMNPQVDLGPDQMYCGNLGPVTLNAGSGYASYLWNNGNTTSSISATTSGEYWVKTTDGNGCDDYDRVEVRFDPGVVGSFSASSNSVLVNDVVTFVDQTPGGLEWCWDFGDGSNLCPIQDSVTHTYAQPGSYQACLIVGNGVCVDTICQTIQVDTLVGIRDPQLAGSLSVYPVPASDWVHYLLEDDAIGSVVLTLHDMAGRTVQASTIEKWTRRLSGDLNLEGLPAGMYLLNLRDATGSISRRVLVE